LVYQQQSTDALFILNNIVRRYIDVNYKVVRIFLDVQNVFDCVNHELLLKKLEFSLIHGVANYLLKSFFSERAHMVKVNDYYSEARSNIEYKYKY